MKHLLAGSSLRQRGFADERAERRDSFGRPANEQSRYYKPLFLEENKMSTRHNKMTVLTSDSVAKVRKQERIA